MEKNIHEEGMEEFLKKSFAQYSENPPDDLWDRIETNLQQPTGTRVRWYWRQTLAVAASLLLGVVTFQYFYYSRELDRLQKGIEKTTAQLEEFEKQFNHTVQTDRQPDKNRVAETPGAKNHRTPVLEMESAGNSRAANSKPNENSLQKPSGIQKTDPLPASKSRPPAEKKMDDFQPLEPNALSPVLAQTNQPEIEGQAILRTGAPVPILQPLPGLTPGMLGYDRAPAPRVNLSPGEKKRSWSVGIETFLMTANLRIKPTFNFPHTGSGKTFEDAADLTGETYIAGLSAGADLGKNWRLESGLNYRKTSYTSTHKPDLRFKDRNQHGGQDHDFSYNLNTAAGLTEIEFRAAQSDASELIDENETVGIEVKTRQEFQYVSMPLMLGYQVGRKRLHFEIKGGLAFNYLLDRSLEISDVRFLNAKFRDPQRKPMAKCNPPAETLSVDYVFGAGVEYDLNERLSIGVSPVLTGSLIKNQMSPFARTGETATGLNMGLTYHF